MNPVFSIYTKYFIVPNDTSPPDNLRHPATDGIAAATFRGTQVAVAHQHTGIPLPSVDPVEDVSASGNARQHHIARTDFAVHGFQHHAVPSADNEGAHAAPLGHQRHGVPFVQHPDDFGEQFIPGKNQFHLGRKKVVPFPVTPDRKGDCHAGVPYNHALADTCKEV